MNEKPSFLLPLIRVLTTAHESYQVTFDVDSFDRVFGIVRPKSNTWRPYATRRQREEFRNWILIQRERIRLGLLPLSSEEMIIF